MMKKIPILFLAFFVILIDQFTKHFAGYFFPVTHNYGAAFGILQGYEFLFIIAAVAVIFFILFSLKSYPFFELGLVLGGTIGNLIDRIFLGYVIDFISVGSWWPSFNIADSANTVGVILLVYRFMKNDRSGTLGGSQKIRPPL